VNKLKSNKLRLIATLTSLVAANVCHAGYMTYSGTDAWGYELISFTEVNGGFGMGGLGTMGMSRGMNMPGGPHIRTDEMRVEAHNKAMKERACKNAKLQAEAQYANCKADAAIKEVGLISQCPTSDYSGTFTIGLEMKVISGSASGTISIPRSTNCRYDAHALAVAAASWCDVVKAEGEVLNNSEGGVCDI